MLAAIGNARRFVATDGMHFDQVDAEPSLKICRQLVAFDAIAQN
ncbi:MAG TPA: hypothetical protein VIM11_01810 [Tepidisphaeraceae bacterium]|jgi:hypothetical protein